MAKETSWEKIVREADPTTKQDIVVYTFGKEKEFKEKQNKGYN